jgi:uridine kinase
MNPKQDSGRPDEVLRVRHLPAIVSAQTGEYRHVKLLLRVPTAIFCTPMQHSPLIIGIAGGTGSGKTTVTEKILARLDVGRVVFLQHDFYYRDLAAFGGLKPDEINFDHPDSLETSLLIKHLDDLRKWKAIDRPVYEFTTYKRQAATLHIEPKAVVIVEGILIFVEKQLRDLMDIKIFVDTDADERLLRRLRRDLLERGRSVESVMQQYVQSVKPMHLEFVEPSKRWADVIIPKGGENQVAIDMVATKITELFRAADL